MKYLVLSVGFLFVLPHFTMAEQGTKEKQEETAPSKTGKQKANKSEKKPAKAAEEAKTAKKVVRENGLEIEDIKVGSGPEAREGNRIRVHYRGTLINGKEFDSNFSDANPEPFILDKGHLIAGWVEGIPGMKVGGKRKLKIPYKLAYGDKGTPDGTIPPKADLNFEVELLKVE